ncbi:MAG TPA: energy transducer TonB [Candidatus Sulfotelmatobacter sp.]|nr:energy transducer TonB [Candidatus Sulfotelmatobacter sp.]
MFEDSLIESGGKLKTKRGRFTTVAFILEIMILIVMVLIPLVFTEALPRTQLMTFLVAPPPPPPPPPPAAAPVHVQKQIQTDIVNGELRTPTKIPQKVKMIQEDEAPPPVAATSGVVGGVPGGVPGGSMGGVIGSVLSSTPVAVPKIATPQRVRVSSGVQSGLLVRKVNPTYPPLARQARIQGVVILQAQISKDGNIENLQLVSGHPMLAPAAIEAVRQWKYKPYLLNGEPVEVETQVQVNFTLAGG